MAVGSEVFDDGNNANNVNEELIIGNSVTGSIHGFKFLDKNANGIYEPCGCADGETPFEWGARLSCWTGMAIRSSKMGTR